MSKIAALAAVFSFLFIQFAHASVLDTAGVRQSAQSAHSSNVSGHNADRVDPGRVHNHDHHHNHRNGAHGNETQETLHDLLHDYHSGAFYAAYAAMVVIAPERNWSSTKLNFARIPSLAPTTPPPIS